MAPFEKTKVENQGIESATIASGTDVSGAFDVGSAIVVAVNLPAAFDGDQLAIECAPVEDGTFQPVYDDAGNEAVVTIAAGRVVSLKDLANVIAPLRHIRFKSRSAGAVENQAAERELILLLKK